MRHFAGGHSAQRARLGAPRALIGLLAALVGVGLLAGPAAAVSDTPPPTMSTFSRTSAASISPGQTVSLSYSANDDSSGVASVVFHYTDPIANDRQVTGTGSSGPATAVVDNNWPAGNYRLDSVVVTDGFHNTKTYTAGVDSLPFDDAGFSVTGTTASSVKPPIRGLLDRNGLAEPQYQGVVNGYVLKANWADLQTTSGGPITSNNAIDQAIAQLRTMNAQNGTSAPHTFLKLRVFAGDAAPDWAKNLDGGPVTVRDTDGVTLDTIGKFWTPDFGAAYQDFMTKMAAEYDGVPEVRDIVVSRCTLSTAEPFQRMSGDATTRQNLLAAGFNTADDHTCHQQETDVHNAVWTHTTSSTAFNPYQQINSDGSRTTDENWTAQMIDYCRTAMGSRCVLENNSIQDPNQPPQNNNYQLMYTKIQGKGAPITYQTSSPGNGLGSLCETIGWAISPGAAGAVELPTGYDVVPLPNRFDHDQAFTVAGMSSYDKALEGAQPPDTDNPTTPGSLSGTVNSSTSVTLNWNAASDGGYGVACYKVFHGGVEVGTTQGTTFTFQGANADDSNPYQVQASDGAGHVGPMASVVVNDTQPPSAPGTVQASGISPTEVDLTWGAATDNFAVDHYTVYRNGTAVGTTGGLSFNDTGLAPSTTYNYTVTATDTSSHEGPGTSTSGTTQADTVAPTTPTNLKATPSMTSVALTWNGSTDNVGVAGYRVYRNNTLVGSPTGTSFTDTGLTPNTSYSYQVSAVDGVPNESARSTTVTTRTLADKTPPSAPTGVTVTDTETSTVSIQWNPSTDNVAVGGYRVYRNGSLVTTVAPSVTSFTDPGLKPNTTYRYTVRAVDTSNNVSASSAAATTTTLPDTQAPGVPVLTVTGTTSSSVSLSWTKPSDNVGVTSFKVLLNGVVVTTTTRTTYTKGSLHAGTTYQFTVRAYDAAGNFTESDPVSATPQ